MSFKSGLGWASVLFYCAVGMSLGYGADPIRVQLRWHHQFQFAGYYAAIEQGYYQQRGLEVELVPIEPGKSPIQQVLAGHADFSQADMGLLAERALGKPLVALAATFQHSPSVLLSLKQSGIKTPMDLKNKRVMMFPGNENFVLSSLIHKYDLSDKIIRLDSSTNLEDLINGSTDAFNAYYSNEPFALEQQGIEYDLILPDQYGIEFYADVIFTSEMFMNQQPKATEDFVEATLEGWRYAMAHPEEIIEVIISKYPSDKSKSHLRYEANVLRSLMMPDLVPIGHMNIERWEKAEKQLQEIGAINRSVDMEQFIYDYKAKAAWRKILLWSGVIITLFSIMAAMLFHYFRTSRLLTQEVARRRNAERRAMDLALHDPLTHLPNRLLFQDRLRQTISRRERDNNQPLFMFIDLDNFKQVNDSYGHEAGDCLLQEIAEALSSITRNNDTCARIAGDEFIVLAEHCDSKAEAKTLIQRTLKALIDKLDEVDPTHRVSVSIGAVLVDRSVSESEVYNMADNLMYQAKNLRDGSFIIRFASECNDIAFPRGAVG